MAANTTSAEDRIISQCASFGGVAEELATVTQWLDDKLTEANDTISELREEIKDLEKATEELRDEVELKNACINGMRKQMEKIQFNGLPDFTRLAASLENLRDEQNGPPLERHKEHWQAARAVKEGEG